MSDDSIPRVRSFNRRVSQTIGVLQDRYLGLDRPLGEARLIFEIGKEGAEVKELRMRLGLDSGYLSRLLRSLERQGLITMPTAVRDRRIRRTKLTRAGVAELKELDRRSDRVAQSILAPLNATQRARLIMAMGEVERLLAVSAVTIGEEPAGSGTRRIAWANIIANWRSGSKRGSIPRGVCRRRRRNSCRRRGCFSSCGLTASRWVAGRTSG